MVGGWRSHGSNVRARAGGPLPICCKAHTLISFLLDWGLGVYFRLREPHRSTRESVARFGIVMRAGPLLHTPARSRHGRALEMAFAQYDHWGVCDVTCT